MAKLPMPFNNPMTYAGHSGVDYPQPHGTTIMASGAGRVTRRSWNKGGGYYIWVKYDALSQEVGYHHMPSHAGCPAVGARVSEGSRLGYVGSTGNSTGPHLHSEVANNRTTAGYWKFFDRDRVVGQKPTPKPKPTPSTTVPKEDDMPIIIVQRSNSQLAKGMMTHNRKMREITRWENIAYRAAQDVAPESVIYVTVSNGEYANLLAGKD